MNHNVVACAQIMKETKCYITVRTTISAYAHSDGTTFASDVLRNNLRNDQMRQIQEEATTKTLGNVL
jgi:hypothetical protein